MLSENNRDGAEKRRSRGRRNRKDGEGAWGREEGFMKREIVPLNELLQDGSVEALGWKKY